MFDPQLHQLINEMLTRETDISGGDNSFYTRFLANASAIKFLYDSLYAHHPQGAKGFEDLKNAIVLAYKKRSSAMKKRDDEKLKEGHWFLSNQLVGMSLYVDRFSGNIAGLKDKIPYLKSLGVNLFHLMPLFESPALESDGGYAVSNFRKIDERFGTVDDLVAFQDILRTEKMHLMLDIVLNHTSQKHEWAEKARKGDPAYQDFFYFYEDRGMPDAFDQSMPEIFPESAPGNFTWVPEAGKWVMTVFHQYQWDLNYTNPAVLVAMMENIFFYANLGVDILRIDAPAFIWKQPGTTSQNLPQAHVILQLIKQCVQVASPGMALLGEAIVSPAEIMKYFGTGQYTARECDFAYNATHMALQWDALATGDIRVMMAAQHEILKKPLGTSWICYTRSHDDIGLGYEDYMIQQAGWNPWEHRNFLKNYYSGHFPGSPATGALFSVNPKTGDARISGTLASLCGLEKAVDERNEAAMETAIRRILLMQGMSFFTGGMPMIFYGDEMGYLNDYSYLRDSGKSYDNRWMHRPYIHWEKLYQLQIAGTREERVFSGTQKLIRLRKKFLVFADQNNLTWLSPHNIHVAAFIRAAHDQTIFALFNFSAEEAFVTWYIFREKTKKPVWLYDHWNERYHKTGTDEEFLVIPPYGFCIMEEVEKPG